jgi:NTP pyrophosphatase (non-canonical NTP hydrolase)
MNSIQNVSDMNSIELVNKIMEENDYKFFKNKEGELLLADEMADVLFVLICLANQTGVDLTTALEKNIEKKSLRDATRHQNNEKLHP